MTINQAIRFQNLQGMPQGVPTGLKIATEVRLGRQDRSHRPITVINTLL